jgi:hypothetical protein
VNVGLENEPVEIEQTTNYPFEDQIQFTICASNAVNFPLSLRIPAWCRNPTLTVNGVPTNAVRTAKGFMVVRRTYKPGDTLTLTLPMETAVTHWPQGGIGLEHGPLVYSLAIKTEWKPIVEDKYTTAEYPSWEATPTRDWNFGLALDLTQPTRGIEFKRRLDHAGEKLDPWENPPTLLRVGARKIENWELLANPEDPAQKFTPPLPELSSSKISQTVVQLTLVPYGSTQLRLTIFPTVTA